MAEIITIHAAFDKAALQDIPVASLHSGAFQPRKEFPEESIAQLSDTIARLGVLEPLIVRPSPQHAGRYEIIAGERRFRAASLAGLQTVPCMVARYSNEQAAQAALIENTSREDLNPIDKATAMQRLATDFHYTHEEIADLLGVSRPHVSNMLRLLRLDGRVQLWLRSGNLSEGHGKVLAGVSYDRQYWFAYEAIKKEWSVNTLDEAIRGETDTKKSRKSPEETAGIAGQITDTLSDALVMLSKPPLTGTARAVFVFPSGTGHTCMRLCKNSGRKKSRMVLLTWCRQDETLECCRHAANSPARV